MDPLTASAVFTAGGAGGAGAAFANPITAAIAAAALGTAYGVSPKFRKKSNELMHKGWEGISNPFQHFGDGSAKDTLGQRSMLAGMMGSSGQPGGHLMKGGIGMFQQPGQNPELPGGGGMAGPMQSIMQKLQQRRQQNQNQQGNQPQMLRGLFSGSSGIPGPIAGINPALPQPAVPTFDPEEFSMRGPMGNVLYNDFQRRRFQ